MFGWLLIPAAYLLGSVSCAIIVCRIMGLPDPREQGSGNPGATNVMRIGGKKAAAITLLGDMLKGFLPVYLANVLDLSPLLLAFGRFSGILGTSLSNIFWLKRRQRRCHFFRGAVGFFLGFRLNRHRHLAVGL